MLNAVARVSDHFPKSFVPLAVAALLLAGCQQDGLAQDPATGATVGRTTVVPATCPPAGTIVQGGPVTLLYQGRNPNNQEQCMVSGRAAWHGISINPADAALLRSVFPPAPGRRGSRTLQDSTGAWRETFEVVDQRQVTVPAGTFDVWVIRRVQERMFEAAGRGVETIYLERDTGMMVRRDIIFDTNWGGANTPFEATRVVRPRPAAEQRR